MPKKLVIVNALLLTIAAVSLVYIAREVLSPLPAPQAGRGRPVVPPAVRAAETPRLPAAAYQVVAARNLFSPTRSEAPAGATAGAAASSALRPHLHGVVLREGAPIAYLEDPTTKRVAGYRVGDTITGGTLQAINADHVVINRPDGTLDVRLRDPAKPRAAPAPPGQGQPAAAAATPALPGVVPPAVTPGVPPIPWQPPILGAPVPGAPQILPGRRPLPPNLLRRVPPGQPSDAPQQ